MTIIEHHSLADAVVVALHSLTLAEENRHALRHVDAYEVIEPTDHRGDGGKRDGFSDGVIAQVAFSNGCDLEVELHDESAIEPLSCNVSELQNTTACAIKNLLQRRRE